MKQNSHLKNVIIVTSLPRYDSAHEDTHGIKSKLNSFGNSLYSSIWMQEGCPVNISIHDQKLDCHGELRVKRFGNPGQQNRNAKPYDGIHMRGVTGGRHYTNSMKRIFASQFPDLLIGWSDSQSESANFHNNCPQTNYRRRYDAKTRANNQGNNVSEQRYNQNTGQGFSQQSGFNRVRGFKKNNHNGQSNNYQHGEKTGSPYNVPVWNRFPKNF